MNDEKMLKLTLDDGTEVNAEIVFTHYSEKYKKNYVVFLPEGDEQYSAASFIEDNETDGHLEPIESEEEWAFLESLLNDYFEDLDSDEEDEA